MDKDEVYCLGIDADIFGPGGNYVLNSENSELACKKRPLNMAAYSRITRCQSRHYILHNKGKMIMDRTMPNVPRRLLSFYSR